MMNKKEFLHLKSGTDVRGTAVETAEHGVQLTDETVQKICVGFYKWYCRKEQVDTFGIAVGQDCRISSPRIAAAAMTAFCACGCRVFDCGLATTPSMFMSIVENEPVQTALEITASHHPFDRNGLKFFTSGGGLEGEDVTAILELAYDAEVPVSSDNAPVALSFMNDYAALLRRQIVDGVQNGDRPLEGLHIVVDAGNGVGGFYADQVLAPLGADVSGSQFLEPDGMFPNHIPNPENKGAIDAASKMVLDSSADLGLIFDTDVDRMGCIGATGQEINRNPLAASAAAILLAAGAKGKRLMLPNARVLIHQPAIDQGFGKATEIEIQAKEMLRMREWLENTLAKHTGQDVEKIRKDIEVDTFLTAQEAKDYGIVDEVLEHRS